MAEENNQQPTGREAGMMTIAGAQGVGKTYLNMHIIKDYVRDKLNIKVRGRKCLIVDTNGEYTKDQFAKNGVPDFAPKLLSLKDVIAWSKANISECRRIDAKNVAIKDKKIILEYLLKHYKNGMLVIEDINTYIINVTHMEEIVGGIVNLRHRGVDVLISYQSLRAVEPRIWANSRWIRMHYQPDNVDHIKNKVTHHKLMKIAQIIVNNKYKIGDKRFYVYVINQGAKLEGKFNKADFMTACRQYLQINKKEVKDYAAMHGVTIEAAIAGQSEEYYNEYYANPDKGKATEGPPVKDAETTEE